MANFSNILLPCVPRKSLFIQFGKAQKPKLLHFFLPLWQVLPHCMCPWGIAFLEWGPSTVTIAVFKPQVPALIKILSPLRVTMNVAFSIGHHVHTSSSSSLVPVFVVCLLLMALDRLLYVIFIKSIIKSVTTAKI